MRRILITGGCGYLGASLCEHFAKKGYGVTAIDNFDPSDYPEWKSLMEEVIIGDIRDSKTILYLLKKEYDIVIHLVSLDHNKSEGDPNYVSSINVMPTWNLLDKFTNYRLEKFIYFSTIQVYGKLLDKRVNENFTPSPNNVYGLTHYISENICNYFHKTTKTTCINVRLSNSYGKPVFKDNNCWSLVINDFCKNAFYNELIRLESDGSPQRDIIHVSDICRGVESIIESKIHNLKYNIFNIASGETYSILELANIVQSLYYKRYNKNIPIYLSDNSILSSPIIIKKDNLFNIDIGKMKDLKFEPRNNLEKGINGIFKYLENEQL